MAGERSDKTERLLNLTLALLATKKPLTKAQIFQRVAGYSGSAESMERMFERDKDELRELGVIIDVLPIDILFDDELGYRIIPNDVFLPNISLSEEESIWLAIATSIIHDIQMKDKAKNALHKLLVQSTSDLNDVVDFSQAIRFEANLNMDFEPIWRAIKSESTLAFRYNIGVGVSSRVVSPYSIISRHGIWYIVARDHKDDRIKTFRCDRTSFLEVTSEKFRLKPSAEEYQEFLANFKGERITQMVARVRQAIPAEHPLVQLASREADHEDPKIGEILTFHELDRLKAKELVLWAGNRIEVLEPEDFRDEIIDTLKKVLEANQ